MAKYFVGKYVTYHDELIADEAIPSKAQTVLSNAETILSEYGSIASFAQTAIWDGEARTCVINQALPTLKDRVSTLKNNISSGLVQACVLAINSLLATLKELKLKDKELEQKLTDLDKLIDRINDKKRALDSASDYETNDKGKPVYTGNRSRLQSEYDQLKQQETDLRNEIKELELLLQELQRKCDDYIKQIEALNGSIALFPGTISDTNIPEIEALIAWQPAIYEENGVFYFTPLCKGSRGQIHDIVEPRYTICIDTNKLRIALGDYADKAYKDTTYYQYIVDSLYSKMKNSDSTSKLFDFTKSTYTRELREVIARTVDQILEDSYAYNGAETVSDYAAIAATTIATNPIAKYGYYSQYYDQTVGVSSVTHSGGKFDCISFVRWCYYQGYSKVYPNENVKFEDWTCISTLYGTDSIKSTRLENLNGDSNFFDSVEVGSLITKRTDGNYHIAMIIGRGVNEEGKETFVLAHSTGGRNGVIINEYTIDTLYESWTSGSGHHASIADPSYVATRLRDSSFV